MFTDTVFTAAEYGFIEGTRNFFPGLKLRNQIIETYQLRQLRKIVSHAFHKSEFYHKLYTDHGIKEKDIPHLLLKDLPIISKKEITENTHAVFTDPNLNYNEVREYIFSKNKPAHRMHNKYFCFTTSGSLGMQLTVVYSAKEWKKIMDTMLIQASAFGRINSKKIKVAGIFRTEGTSAAITLIRSLSPKSYDLLELSVASPLREMVEELNAFMPDQVIAYPGIFVALMPYKRNGMLKINPKFIALGGEILTMEEHNEIAQAFGAKVLNSYGASECLNLGTKQTGDKHFKMFPNFACLEVLNDHNEHVQPGETGKVVMTNLLNYTQPFIRYTIGDVAVFDKNERGESCIKEIVSRSYKPVVFETNSGEESTFHPFIFYETLLYVPGVGKTQVTIGKNKLDIRVIGSDEGVANVTERLQNFLFAQHLDKNLKVHIQKVDEIKPEANGKIPVIKYDTQQQIIA